MDNQSLAYVFKAFEARISKLEEEVKALKGCDHDGDIAYFDGPRPTMKCKKCGEFYR